jgi:hypothetical protein
VALLVDGAAERNTFVRFLLPRLLPEQARAAVHLSEVILPADSAIPPSQRFKGF